MSNDHDKTSYALGVIHDAIDMADAVVAKGRDAFDDPTDPTLRGAGAYALVILGAGVARLPEEFINAHPGLPWREARGVRNVTAHYQSTMDNDIIWQTLAEDLEPFRRLLERYGI